MPLGLVKVVAVRLVVVTGLTPQRQPSNQSFGTCANCIAHECRLGG